MPSKSVAAPLPVTEVVETPDPISDWKERQKQLHPDPTFKEPWFSIVGEVEPKEPARPSVIDVQRAVAKFYNVPRTDILSARRTAPIVRPRQVAMYLAKTLTLRSFPELGRRFGGRDHTTVLHAVRKITNIIEQNPQLADEISCISRTLCAVDAS